MASISSDRNGNRTIQFVGRDGKRRSIRLGRIPVKSAATVKIRVEALVASQFSQQPIDVETARWLGAIDDKLRNKLVAVGLAEATAKPEQVTVASFVDGYLQRRTDDVKVATRVVYSHTIRNLKTFFGSGKPINAVHAGDADDFKRHLLNVEKLSSATIVRRCGIARTFFKDAMRRKLIDSNPFEGVGKGSTANPERSRFIDGATIQKVIDACPNAQWRCLVALSRFGGLRVPSEPLLLKWQDIDFVGGTMKVSSPKTEHHAGKASRKVPIFPELRPYLEDCFELAEDGAEYVLPSLRRPGIATGDWRNVNFGTMFIKIIRRAGLEPWPRSWHNLRASRQTELTESFPSHVVASWLGNSERVADKHYLQVLDSHFQKALQKPVQSTAETDGNGSQRDDATKRKTPEIAGNQQNSGVFQWAILDSNQ